MYRVLAQQDRQQGSHAATIANITGDHRLHAATACTLQLPPHAAPAHTGLQQSEADLLSRRDPDPPGQGWPTQHGRCLEAGLAEPSSQGSSLTSPAAPRRLGALVSLHGTALFSVPAADA